VIEERSSLCDASGVFAAPDLIEPIAAFRSWRVIDGRLRSPYLPVFWDERILEARCSSPGVPAGGAPHLAPEPACGCGIYAYLEPDRDFPKIDYRGVAGIVTLWGRIEVHDEGMRAEHAQIEALALYARQSARQKSAIWAIADALGIDLIGLDEIGDAAVRYGGRLPATLLPAPIRS
jgi:hypothetical protein